MLPNFIGIGAPRCATTWLYMCLKEHPQVFIPKVKETNFLDSTNFEEGVEKYETYFHGGERFLAIGEISTRYLISYKAPERIKKYIPNIHLFVSLRNPVEQVYSHYWHLLRQNFHQWEPIKVPLTFEEALEKYETTLLENAFYYKHLSRWLKYFDLNQLHIIFYDDIKSSPVEVIKRLYSYIGVDKTFKPLSLNRRDSSVRYGHSPKNKFIEQFYLLLYNYLNIHIYYPLKKAIGMSKAVQIKDKLRIRRILEMVFQREGYNEMKAETRSVLHERFREDIQKLAKITGRNLNHWK